jgi:CRISPR/Cas system-associated protein Cas10 (large subunit of type III CRISPR-Cas system)
LETLLWGGDEVMWVLPAFKAWEFMKVVQRNLKDKSIWGDDLTHSCGLLIAPYKALIKDLRALVNNLGDVAKDCPDGRKMNGVQIEFIKSFDLPGLSAALCAVNS